MLCPKCGYITFDELPACPKCKKDWSGVVGKINGLGSMIEAPSFLRSVLSGQEEDVDMAGAPDLLDEEEANEEDAAEGDGVSALSEEKESTIEEAGGIDFAMDELPDANVVETDLDIPEITITPEADEVLVGEEPGSIEFKGELDLSLEDDEDVSSPPALEIEEKDEPQDNPRVSLDDIDLSDLMDPGGDDEPNLDVTSSGEDQEVPDLLGIDLDLSLEDDGDGLDLSLEPEASLSPSVKKVDDSVIPDLGLTLDLDE